MTNPPPVDPRVRRDLEELRDELRKKLDEVEAALAEEDSLEEIRRRHRIEQARRRMHRLGWTGLVSGIAAVIACLARRTNPAGAAVAAVAVAGSIGTATAMTMSPVLEGPPGEHVPSATPQPSGTPASVTNATPVPEPTPTAQAGPDPDGDASPAPSPDAPAVPVEPMVGPKPTQTAGGSIPPSAGGGVTQSPSGGGSGGSGGGSGGSGGGSGGSSDTGRTGGGQSGATTEPATGSSPPPKSGTGDTGAAPSPQPQALTFQRLWTHAGTISYRLGYRPSHRYGYHSSRYR